MMIEFWFNFRTKEYEGLAETPQDFADYIPQEQAAQNLYKLYIEHFGLSPIDAAKKVLEAVCGFREKG